jgi:hypothetical protein
VNNSRAARDLAKRVGRRVGTHVGKRVGNGFGKRIGQRIDKPVRNRSGSCPAASHADHRGDNPPMRRPTLLALLLGASIAACTPALDWRDVRPEGSAASLQFPCKPQSQTRQAALDGEATTMTLVSCTADGLTFALVHADLGDPARVTPALIAMRKALVTNLGATQSVVKPFVLTGMTPSPEAVRLQASGHTPEGAPIVEEAVLFTRGTRVYQAAVLGARPDAAAVELFFESLRLES